MTTLKLLPSLLLTSAAIAQTPLDPTMAGAYPAFPAYLDHKCGSVATTEYAEDGDTGYFRFSTVCAGSGRGSKSTVYLACWRAAFAADRFYIVDREALLVAHWKQGSAAAVCPQA